ncbi:unnamed protein product [Pleuronectes platessa]|uniref:Uncharacterized protein n=1 Tax=Pleuronectes platessa TaxID=8262 RepID=A0A9N7UGE4_PLEPL|nr:unnamed protein product [Pleuronectes platessa]
MRAGESSGLRTSYSPEQLLYRVHLKGAKSKKLPPFLPPPLPLPQVKTTHAFDYSTISSLLQQHCPPMSQQNPQQYNREVNGQHGERGGGRDQMEKLKKQSQHTRTPIQSSVKQSRADEVPNHSTLLPPSHLPVSARLWVHRDGSSQLQHSTLRNNVAARTAFDSGSSCGSLETCHQELQLQVLRFNALITSSCLPAHAHVGGCFQ